MNNQTKNATTYTNQAYSSVRSHLFDDSNTPFDPDTNLPFEDEATVISNDFTNQTKNTNTFTNQTKN